MQQLLIKQTKCFVLLLFVFFAATGAFAQALTVTGKVTDEKGGGLPGVTVLLKGSTNGTATDPEGNYTLAIPNGNATLVVTFIGYSTQEIAVNNRTAIDISLKPDTKALEEVVVIGYGQTVSKDALTGSVSSVGAKQLQDVPVSTAAEALAGRLAGVQVTTTEGSPGAEIQIRVRGGNSITSDNSPLYIVDGIRMDNALSILSPQEIQSIDVLKDAASTAIYGSQGANGVVLITTRGGRDMKTQVTYNGFAGVRRIVNKLEVMNPYDYALYQYQIYNYNTNEETRNSFRDRYGRYEDLELYKNMPTTNWQDEVFGQEAFSQTHVLGLTGGTKATTFNFTLNHTDEEGIMLNSGYVRTLASLKFDHNVTERFRVGVNTRYSRQRVNGVGTSNTGTQSSNRLRNAVRFRPFVAPGLESQVDVFDEDYANLTNLTSPLLLANQELRYDYRNDINLNGYISLELVKGLTYRGVVGINNNDRRTNNFNGPITSVARQNADMPVIQMGEGEGLTLTQNNTLNYQRKFGADHDFNILLGQEIVTQQARSANITTKWLPVDITPEQAFAGIQKATPPVGLIQDAPSTSQSGTRLFSLFTRAMYNYKGKYLTTLSLRRDGSSLFAPENRNAYFPSVQLAWRVSDEPFMDQTNNWLSDLKLRLSYGTAGNNKIGLDLYKTMFGTSTNDGYAFSEAITPGFVSSDLANSFIRWERTISRNVGLDFSLFNSRLNATVDVYKNNTDNLLLRARIPQTSGYESQIQNVGQTENKGIELQLDGNIINNRDFTWNANFNVGINRNKIVNLGTDPSGNLLNSYLEYSGWVSATYQDFLVEVGKPIGQFYGYVTDGYYGVDDFNATFDAANNTWTYVLKEGIANSRNIALGNRDPQPGDLKLKDLTDDGSSMVTTNDRTVLGNAQPKFIGGLNQQFAYKGFDMSLFMNFSVGNKVYNANKIEFTTQYLYRDNNMLALMNDRWKMFDDNGVQVTDPEQLKALNANTKYWTPPVGQYFLHSFAIEDGSFLRINNLTLGYTLPETLLMRTKILSKVRVYGTVNNLLTITGYSGYDPEANTRRSNPLTPAVDYAAYPRSRYILGGVNVTF